MAEILTSIHGRLIGLGKDRELIVPAGFVAGSHGSQIAMPSPSKVTLFDDFLGDVIADEWNTRVGSDVTATVPSVAINTQIGGVLRLATGDSASSMAADGAQLESALNWQASNGGLVFEARVNLAAITAVACFLGFTDQASALEMPIQSAASANTLTTNASDAVGVMFDTSMTDDNWWLVGVDTDADATHQNSGFAPVAATFETWRIEVTATGEAVFFRNGIQVGTRMSAAVAPGTDLTPVVAMFPRTTAQKTLDLDYIHVAMNR